MAQKSRYPPRYIGTPEVTSTAQMVERAHTAFAQGYNSLFVVRDGSFHASFHTIYAQRREQGRRVTNIAGWIAKAEETALRRSMALWQMVRQD